MIWCILPYYHTTLPVILSRCLSEVPYLLPTRSMVPSVLVGPELQGRDFFFLSLFLTMWISACTLENSLFFYAPMQAWPAMLAMSCISPPFLMARDEQRTAAWQHWAREGHQDESSERTNGRGWGCASSVPRHYTGCLSTDGLHPQDPVAQLTGRSNQGALALGRYWRGAPAVWRTEMQVFSWELAMQSANLQSHMLLWNDANFCLLRSLRN